MGMVRAAQKGEGVASPEVAQVEASMKKKDVKDFASTKHKGLPEKKVSKNHLRLILRNIDRHKEQKRLEPSLNRDRQRGKERLQSQRLRVPLFMVKVSVP